VSPYNCSLMFCLFVCLFVCLSSFACFLPWKKSKTRAKLPERTLCYN
jgi:hypothetical protein